MNRWHNNQFLQALLIALLLYVLWHLRVVVVVVFVAFLLATVGWPLVDFLKRHHMPTALAIFLPIVVVLGGLSFLLSVLLPPFVNRVIDFSGQLPHLLNTLSSKLHLKLNTAHLSSYLSGHASNLSHYAFTFTGRAVTILAALLSILVLCVYWLGSYERVQEGILELFPPRPRRRMRDVWLRIERKLQLWFKAHLMLNTAVGLMVWISMTLLHVPFAELLALTAFLIEIIPTAGPIMAAIPAILLGLSKSLITGLVVLLVYIVIQQIESHILSPMLLGKTVRLHPIVIIVSLLVGAEVYSIVGALLAVPTALCISAVVDSYRGDPLPRDDAPNPKRAVSGH